MTNLKKSKTETDAPDLMDAKEVAEYLGLTPAALRQPYINIPKVPDEYPAKYRREHVDFAREVRRKIDHNTELLRHLRNEMDDLHDIKNRLRAILKNPDAYPDA